MPKITFVEPDGQRRDVDGSVGDSLMRSALDNGVVGIAAECGGCLSCATCHAYIDEEWFARLPPPSEEEMTMLECAVDVQPNSRLTCQVAIADDLDGLIVNIPKSQY